MSKKTTFPCLSLSSRLERSGELATSRRRAKMFSPARWIEPLGMAEGMSYLQQGRRRGEGEDWVGGDGIDREEEKNG